MRGLPSLRAIGHLLLSGVLLATVAGCGKSLPTESAMRAAGVTTVAGSGAPAASGLVMENTTRLGGANPIMDAAAVALAVDPGLTPATRPEAVVLVNDEDWATALAAAALSSAPLGAPVLYSEGDTLPAVSAQALAAMHPRGARLLGGAQVIAIGTAAAPPHYRTRWLSTPRPASGEHTTGGAGEARGGEAGLVAKVEHLIAILHGGPPRRVIAIGADGPRALAMPAAGLAAETGAPILPVDARGIPVATRQTLIGLRRPVIYAVGPPAAVSVAVLAKLARLGSVRRISDESASAGASPAANAVALAHYSDGSFGWGVAEPGHSLVFVNAGRPLDAPAVAPLAASGAPLLLLEAADRIPATLANFLSDIKPGYPEYEATRGFYNRGWVVGDEYAVAATAQAELDAMLQSTPDTPSPATQESAEP